MEPKTVFIPLRTLRSGFQAIEKIELWLTSSREQQTTGLIRSGEPLARGSLSDGPEHSALVNLNLPEV